MEQNINHLENLKDEDYEGFFSFFGEQPYTQCPRSTIIATAKDFTRLLREKNLISYNPLIMLSGIKTPKRKDLPKFYNILEEVRKHIAVIDSTTNHGNTTYAMLLIVAVYGMRGVDVTLLTLDDIGWEEWAKPFVKA